METFTITKAHVDQDGRYIGPAPKFKGNVLIKGGLGHVRFKSLSVQGSIIVEPGSTVSAVKGITAGVSISAGEDNSAKTIFARLQIMAVKAVKGITKA